MNDASETCRRLEQLLAIMRSLRDPEQGCPWDCAQTFATIVPHTLEEAYELAEAIETGNAREIRDELGDLLFQVVFYAQLAAEQDWFDFAGLAAGLSEKLQRRHPHVFADAASTTTADLNRQWDAIKAMERQQDGKVADDGVLAAVSRALPALVRAGKLQKRAARIGFDWPDVDGVIAKLQEELQELRDELADPADQDRIAEECGDLLFACVNMVRHAGVDAESALRGANRKFEQRFRYIEQQLAARGKTPAQATLAEMDALWEESKKR